MPVQTNEAIATLYESAFQAPFDTFQQFTFDVIGDLLAFDSSALMVGVHEINLLNSACYYRCRPIDVPRYLERYGSDDCVRNCATADPGTPYRIEDATDLETYRTIYGGPQNVALSDGEQRTALLFANRQTHQKIAQQFGISHHTVRNQIANVYRKLDVQSKVELIRLLGGGERLNRSPSGCCRTALAGQVKALKRVARFCFGDQSGVAVFAKPRDLSSRLASIPRSNYSSLTRI